MPTPLSRLPRKQRKAVFTAHNFARRRYLTVPLSQELRRRYGRRQLPVRKGDTVRVVRGSYEGQEERVAKIDARAGTVTLDNITVKKADQKLKPLPVRPNHLLLTRLNLSDAWRRRILKVTQEEVTPEAVAAPSAPAPSESAAEAPKRPTPPSKETTE
jgi:large subunit ribosomal protein L24